MVKTPHQKYPGWRSRHKSLRSKLAEAQNWRCCYCGVRMEGINQEANAPTFEHIQPIGLGGKLGNSQNISNLVVACYTCNAHRCKEINAFMKAYNGELNG